MREIEGKSLEEREREGKSLEESEGEGKLRVREGRRGSEWVKEREMADQAFGWDTAREGVQKKTFTKWVNTHLRKAGTSVDDLFLDLRDGEKLLQLLEVLRETRLPRQKGKMAEHHMANLNTVLDFLDKDGVYLMNMSAADLAGGNAKLTLDLVWKLILRYQISGQKEASQQMAMDAMKNWCRNCTKSYTNVDVDNFTTSWRNGLAFSAIIHCHRPELIEFAALSADHAAENLKQAFEVQYNDLLFSSS